MPLRQTYRVPAIKLDATGSGTVQFVARGDVLIQHTNILVLPVAPATASKLIPTALVTVNGDTLEGSQTGNFDSSDTTHLMAAGDELLCTWTGGDPGAVATLTLRGIQYPAGEGIRVFTNAVQ
jgi:hypothetical protein